MSTTKRRRRHARSGLTPSQQEILIFGFALGGGDEAAFADVDDMRRCWRENRSSIMAEWNRPGARPMGFYQFDLALIGEHLPCSWWQELAILDTRGLLTADEVLLLERDHAVLAANQSAEPGYCGVGEPTSAASLLTTEDRVRVRGESANFERFVASWHQKRGRAELVEKFRRRAEAFEKQISDLRENGQ